jgi:ribonuclease HI
MTSKKYYAVLKGRKTGIFTSWKDCEEQIKGFSGALYKSFTTKEEAEAALNLSEQAFISSLGQKTKKISKPETTTISSTDEIIMDSVCVDASCRGNPGDVEYRGVYTATREVIFHKQQMSYGTNNLGEFLAIVHALAYLKNQDKDIPIYSDSQTAILWVKNKKVRTKLKRIDENQELFNLVDRGLKWLENNTYNNPILKWNTILWGEIPADFGRK